MTRAQAEDRLDDLAPPWVDHHSLLHSSLVVKVDLELVPVRQVSDEVPALSGAPPSCGHRQPTPPAVLVVALAGHNRIEQITEGVGVLDRPDTHVVLQRPQRDLDGMPGVSPIAPC